MNELKLKKIINVFAYAAVVFLGIALLIDFVFGGVATNFKTIADVIAYIIVSIFAFFYAKTKSHIAYMLVYIVSVILIVLMIILPFVIK